VSYYRAAKNNNQWQRRTAAARRREGKQQTPKKYEDSKADEGSEAFQLSIDSTARELSCDIFSQDDFLILRRCSFVKRFCFSVGFFFREDFQRCVGGRSWWLLSAIC
jgi:hypothetical protein